IQSSGSGTHVLRLRGNRRSARSQTESSRSRSSLSWACAEGGRQSAEILFCVRTALRGGETMQAVEVKKKGSIDPILTRSAVGLARRCEKTRSLAGFRGGDSCPPSH